MNITYSVWKPENIVSYDIVRIAKKTFGLNHKVGHAGTLDPFAEGVLVLCFGDKTKDISKIMAMQKEYVGHIKLGIETDTLDKNGSIYKTADIPKLDEKKIMNIFQQFTGNIHQTPPPFSALKLNGRCLYEYARLGIRIIKQPRKITINELQLINYNGIDSISFKVLCSSGTYIRSLASDIAIALGTHGYLEKLQRVRIGEYTRENSLSLEELINGNFK